MNERLADQPFDAALSPGAHNAIHTCLRVAPDEKTTVITDLASLEIAASLARTLARGLEVAAEEPRRVRLVRYDDLVARPAETVASIEAGFDVGDPEALEPRARAWLAANPQGSHGAHRYSLADYGLDEGQVDELFAGPEEALGRLAARVGP